LVQSISDLSGLAFTECGEALGARHPDVLEGCACGAEQSCRRQVVAGTARNNSQAVESV
jgi:hypothetical protein